MKKILYLVFVFTIGNTITTKAQDQFTGIVNYHFIINNPDGTTFARPYKLYFNNKVSFHVANGWAERIDHIDDLNTMETTGKMIERKNIQSTLPKDYVYTNLKNKILIFQEEIVQKLYTLTDDSIPNIKWELSTENKKIGKYTCQKAVGFYRGRTYTVWFTTEIPVSHGPWKLRGLPGLILEAKDDRSKFSFRAAKVNLNPNKKEVLEKLKKPELGKLSNMEKYRMAIKNRQKDFDAMYRASSSRRNIKFKEGCDECPKAEDLSLEIFK
ncbi:GLPGLI family protein [Aquimarina algiphila]|uniref:GLPGLI family protein n=1 Tax=Aquimarina algiphila TaxID=2047982 RepID=UPI00232FF514|nr:GLPGLI family protein [Aquimarina algiphila]